MGFAVCSVQDGVGGTQTVRQRRVAIGKGRQQHVEGRCGILRLRRHAPSHAAPKPEGTVCGVGKTQQHDGAQRVAVRDGMQEGVVAGHAAAAGDVLRQRSGGGGKQSVLFQRSHKP